MHLVTDDPMAAACPSCGVFSTSVKQYRTARPTAAAARVAARLRRHAARAIGAGRPVAGAVSDLPISWPTGHDAFVGHADSTLTEPAPPTVLGIDETRRGRPRWTRSASGRWVKLERFETNFVDLDRQRRR